MKPARRLISGALGLAMAFSLWAGALPGAQAAPAAPAGQAQALTGSIGLTLRFDLPQTAANAADREIALQVSGPGGTASVALPGGALTSNSLGAQAAVLVKNVDGVELTSETRVGYYEVELSGLPAGGARYTLTLTGTGYKTYSTDVTLDGYSRHVIVGTGDGTFSLGDIDGNGAVDAGDLTAFEPFLGDGDTAEGFDLNGDGQVDVTDLAYVNHNRGISGESQVLDAAAIVSPSVDTAGLSVNGQVADLFRDGGVVTLAPAAGDGGPAIPIELARPVEMSRIQITCPEGNGAIRAGEAVVELDGGSTLRVPFDVSLPEGVHAIGRTAGQRVVTVDLGKKVAVKKVTIQVTATDGPEGYAAVTKIEFLKDIVPKNPKNDADQAKGLAAAPGDGQVVLTWNAVRNVTGYTVAYGESAGDLSRTSSVNTNRAVISGLENMKTYYFQVTAVNGGWRGTPSEVVSGTPEPGKIPGAPSNIQVAASDESLRLSWGSTKDATYYQVFYREAGQSAFRQFGGNLSGTSAAITGLTNGTTYQVAVKAGNGKGVGPYSAIAAGTPRRETLELPSLPEEDRIDNSMVQSVVMENPGNVDLTRCPRFTTADVLDGDGSTFWIAQSWSLSSRFTYTFREPQDMNYAVLVPCLSGNYKYALRSYTVSAKNSAGETVLEQALYPAARMDGGKNYLVLTFPMTKGVKELSITLNEWEGNGCRVSVSEMAFYKSDSLADDIAALFTDGSFTALRPGVDAERTGALSQRLEARADFYLDLARLRDELDLAKNLLAGADGALGVVRDSVQSRSAARDSQYGQGASDLQPLGVTARAGAVAAVYAQLPSDAPVYVVPTQFYGESGVWRGAPIQLVNGRNYITVPQIGSLTDERGGPLYLAYAGDHPEQIRIQVRGDGNVFAMPVLELSGWYDMSESARRETIRAYVVQLQAYVSALNSAALGVDVRNATEISTPSVLLSIPADRALAGLRGVNGSVDQMAETMYQDVLAWEEELFVANKVQGIIASGAQLNGYRYPMTTRQNIRYMRMFAGAFMYAAGNHVGVGYGSTSGLMSGRASAAAGEGRANGLFGWGIAHEIGHNMDKLGKAEITNNIYSLAIQAWDGGSMAWPTRLTISNIWPAVFEKTAAARPGAAGNVFVQLGMYWQLHLAYDQADRPLDFFNRFFRSWKAGEYGGYSYDERVALIASKTAGRNLAPFFTRWGLTLSQEVKELLAQYDPEPRAVWYLNDDAYAYRLKGGAAFEGGAEVSAAVEDNQVRLTIAGGNESVLGYEVLRGGSPVGFITRNDAGETVYTDDLGAANNLTYSYSVVPVDKLGNAGKAAAPVEVRVAYDKAIRDDLYTAARDGNVVTITIKGNPVPVTGVKITGTALDGGYKVELKASPEAAWTTVKQGALSGGTVVEYFAKPGAEDGDTRIWTYDAAALRITGVPEGASVVPLDYPGDRVDFYEDAFVGLLKEDCRYAEGEDGVIPKGTVVVLGTYRGDPVYNTVEIQARYSTTPEAGEATEAGATFKEQPMNGYAVLFAEIPKDGAVSDTSDGFWIFVPDWEKEDAFLRELLKEEELPGGGEVVHSPAEIRAVFYRNDDPEDSASRRETSQTLWISFPERASLPEIELKGGN